MRNGIVRSCLLVGCLLIATAIPSRSETLYRTNAAGTWADSRWVDATLNVYAEPTNTDTAIIGYTGLPGVVSATVTVTVGGAVASNVYLGYYQGTVTKNPNGTLVLADNTTLTITNKLMIGSGGAATKSGSGSVIMGTNTFISMGQLAITKSSFTFKGGSLTVAGAVSVADGFVNPSTSILIQDGGTQAFGGNVTVGNTAPGATDVGYLIVTNGASLTVAGQMTVGAETRGKGSLVVSADSTLNVLNLMISSLVGGTCTIRGNLSVTNQLTVGGYRSLNTTFEQNGGTLTAGSILVGGGTFDANDVGIFRLLNGASLQLTRRATGATTNYASGAAGVFQRGYWYVGDSNTPGTVTLTGAGSGKHDLIVRSGSALTNNGAVVGWGSFGMDGRLTMNGFIIADGYGTERDLTMTNFSAVANSIENTTTNIGWSTNGWYARNGGRLLLPAQTISSGNSTVNWGEAIADTNIDLVNSASMTFSGVDGGKLAVSLLATNRADAAVSSGNVIGEWAFDTTGGFAFGTGTATVSFRYDSVLATQKGLNEADLKLWRLGGTKWQDVTGSINTSTNNKQIISVPLSSFCLFAVSTDVPKAAPASGAWILVR